MQTKRLTKSLLCILCIVLIAVTALFTGCGNNTNVTETPQTTFAQADVTVVGEGETKFDFTVTDADGNVSNFEVHTDKTIVGEALLDVNLIDGEDSEYGLFVKTVNGITVDYDKDGKYWAFYVNDEYAQSGVDTTEIEAGSTYSFKVE